MLHFDPNTAYNQLPDLPPRSEVETTLILRKCVTARAAVAELKAASELIPNPEILINTLPLLEAKDSSEIENIITTPDKLFQHANASNARLADPATKEALRYRSALYEGFKEARERPIKIDLALRICSIIKDDKMMIRSTPGTRLINDHSGQTIYTPPSGEAVIRKLLLNWEHYLQDDSPVDPLIRMAVAHYQFEAIHPFNDGNGRTGRVLNVLYLVNRGLLSQPILHLSREINRARSKYYELLTRVTAQSEWELWVLYMLNAVEVTAVWTCQKIHAMRKLMGVIIDQVRETEPKIYSRELVEIIFARPYCRIEHLVAAGIAKRQTASEYLKKLAATGILDERTVGREKLFVNVELARLLLEPDKQKQTAQPQV